MACDLQCVANISSVATLFITAMATLVGVWGYFSYRFDLRQKRLRLEGYLKEQRGEPKDKGQRSLLHLVRHIGLTEDEVIQLSFKSERIERRIKEDEEGYARSLLFEYIADS